MEISQIDFQIINQWMYRNARPLDIARWQYHFENGNSQSVIRALQAYQNPDGGFGNAIEADSWNPNSSPYSTSIALSILEEIKFSDSTSSIIKSILEYLKNTNHFLNGIWPAVIKSNNNYPHAPWWTWNENCIEQWGYTPTLKLVSFILRFENKNSNLFKKATNIINEAVDKYLNGFSQDGKAYRAINREGEINGYLYLLNSLEEKRLTALYPISDLKTALKNQVKKFIEYDSSKWNQYCHKPSSFISSPISFLYEGNEEIMDTELHFIINQRNTEGIWNITWKWEAYEKEFSISENWWKANIVLWNTLLLKEFGMIQYC